MSMLDLTGITCPFDPVWVIEKEPLRLAPLGAEAAMFRTLVFSRGIDAQLAYHLSVNKTALLHQLRSCVPGWYDRQAIWKQFPGVADSISIPGVEEAMGAQHEVLFMWPDMKFDPAVQSIALQVMGMPVVA